MKPLTVSAIIPAIFLFFVLIIASVVALKTIAVEVHLKMAQ